MFSEGRQSPFCQSRQGRAEKSEGSLFSFETALASCFRSLPPSPSPHTGCKLWCNNDVALSFHPGPGHSPISTLEPAEVHGEENFLVSPRGGWACLHPRCANPTLVRRYIDLALRMALNSSSVVRKEGRKCEDT